MLDDKELLAIYEEVLTRKAKLISLENIKYMKLLMCFKCGDMFNLSREEKTCGCGETKGRYVDELNAEISGNCQPIGIANGSFSQSMKVQYIQDKKPRQKGECCKGVEFTAFFIPASATSITKID